MNITKLTLLNQLLSKSGLSLNNHLMLCIIEQNQNINMTQLSRCLSVTKSAMTGLVDTLEKRELIKREFIYDRRQVNISLTQKGTELLSYFREKISPSV